MNECSYLSEDIICKKAVKQGDNITRWIEFNKMKLNFYGLYFMKLQLTCW